MTESVVILCNGAFPSGDYPLYLLDSAGAVVCCDGAAVGYLAYGKVRYGKEKLPDVVTGDLDSLPADLRESLGERVVLQEEQDYNDLVKAMRIVLSRWPDVADIHILGATGLREDHSVGNMSLLMEFPKLFPSCRDIRIDMVSDHGTMFALQDSCELHLGTGRKVSIFSPDNQLTIKSHGLVWQTAGVVFDNWWKATLNEASEDVVKLEFSKPSSVLIFID